MTVDNDQYLLKGNSKIKAIMDSYKHSNHFYTRFHSSNNGLYKQALTDRKWSWLLGMRKPNIALWEQVGDGMDLPLQDNWNRNLVGGNNDNLNDDDDAKQNMLDDKDTGNGNQNIVAPNPNDPNDVDIQGGQGGQGGGNDNRVWTENEKKIGHYKLLINMHDWYKFDDDEEKYKHILEPIEKYIIEANKTNKGNLHTRRYETSMKNGKKDEKLLSENIQDALWALGFQYFGDGKFELTVFEDSFKNIKLNMPFINSAKLVTYDVPRSSDNKNINENRIAQWNLKVTVPTSAAQIDAKFRKMKTYINKYIQHLEDQDDVNENVITRLRQISNNYKTTDSIDRKKQGIKRIYTVLGYYQIDNNTYAKRNIKIEKKNIPDFAHAYFIRYIRYDE